MEDTHQEADDSTPQNNLSTSPGDTNLPSGDADQGAAPATRRISPKAAAAWLGVFVVVAGVLVALAGRGSSPGPSDAQRNVIPDRPIEQQLTDFDAGYLVSEYDPTLHTFRYLLDEIERKSGATHAQIAEITIKAHNQIIEKYGQNVKVLKLMQAGLAVLSSEGGFGRNYAEVMEEVAVRYAQ